MIRWAWGHAELVVCGKAAQESRLHNQLVTTYVRSALQTLDLFLRLHTHLAAASTSRSTLNLVCRDFSLFLMSCVVSLGDLFKAPPPVENVFFFFFLHLFLCLNIEDSLCPTTVCMCRVWHQKPSTCCFLRLRRRRNVKTAETLKMDFKILIYLKLICVQHLNLWWGKISTSTHIKLQIELIAYTPSVGIIHSCSKLLLVTCKINF